MTGYGQGEAQGPGQIITAEARSVNHRYLEIVIRSPREFAVFDERVRALVAGRLARGRVDLFLNREFDDTRPRHVRVDVELARGYQEALSAVARELGREETPSLSDLLRLPDLVKVEPVAEDLEQTWVLVEAAVQRALAAMLAMRESEGERLRADLAARLAAISDLVREIEARAPELIEAYREKLRQRLVELGAAPAIDPARLAVEVVFYAEKSDISEEVVRLKSHLEHARALLESGEPVGRKLDFLVQELHREINTVGSKVGDASTAMAVVSVKSELERIREQVQNVE